MYIRLPIPKLEGNSSGAGIVIFLGESFCFVCLFFFFFQTTSHVSRNKKGYAKWREDVKAKKGLCETQEEKGG